MPEILNNGFLRVTNQSGYIRLWYKTYLNDKLIEEKFFTWDNPRSNFERALKSMAKAELKRKKYE